MIINNRTHSFLAQAAVFGLSAHNMHIPVSSWAPWGYHKLDKVGRPVYIQLLGKIDLPRIKKCCSEDRMLKFHIQVRACTSQRCGACVAGAAFQGHDRPGAHELFLLALKRSRLPHRRSMNGPARSSSQCARALRADKLTRRSGSWMCQVGRSQRSRSEVLSKYWTAGRPMSGWEAHVRLGGPCPAGRPMSGWEAHVRLGGPCPAATCVPGAGDSAAGA
eukprot:359303-Chlamydomonas_euryale.AAC.8